jgi:3-hydroxypropanoate dehydrogenase
VIGTLDDVVARKAARALDARALRAIFTEARTARGFIDRPLPPGMLERLVALAQLGPTESNAQPLRLVFVASADAKERLRPLLSRGNVEKTMAAPVTAIVAADLRFYEQLPRLSPQLKMNEYYANPANAEKTARSATINAAMQGAYLIVAARALGLDVGPMAGFDRVGTDAEFFPGGGVQSLWLANLGYADDEKTPARNPRFAFSDIARVV